MTEILQPNSFELDHQPVHAPAEVEQIDRMPVVRDEDIASVLPQLSVHQILQTLPPYREDIEAAFVRCMEVSDFTLPIAYHEREGMMFPAAENHMTRPMLSPLNEYFSNQELRVLETENASPYTERLKADIIGLNQVYEKFRNEVSGDQPGEEKEFNLTELRAEFESAMNYADAILQVRELTVDPAVRSFVERNIEHLAELDSQTMLAEVIKAVAEETRLYESAEDARYTDVMFNEWLEEKAGSDIMDAYQAAPGDVQDQFIDEMRGAFMPQFIRAQREWTFRHRIYPEALKNDPVLVNYLKERGQTLDHIFNKRFSGKEKAGVYISKDFDRASNKARRAKEKETEFAAYVQDRIGQLIVREDERNAKRLDHELNGWSFGGFNVRKTTELQADGTEKEGLRWSFNASSSTPNPVAILRNQKHLVEDPLKFLGELSKEQRKDVLTKAISAAVVLSAMIGGFASISHDETKPAQSKPYTPISQPALTETVQTFQEPVKPASEVLKPASMSNAFSLESK